MDYDDIPVVLNKTYPGIGKCIYCGAARYCMNDPARKLGDEHIIPLSLHAKLIIKDASCRNCEALTSAVEDKCIKGFFNAAIPHLGFKGRKSGKVKNKIAVGVGNPRNKQPVDLPDHPGALFSFSFPPPRIIAGLPPSDKLDGAHMVVCPIVPDPGVRVNRFQKEMFLSGAMDPVQFMRMLAKNCACIRHCRVRRKIHALFEWHHSWPGIR